MLLDIKPAVKVSLTLALLFAASSTHAAPIIDLNTKTSVKGSANLKDIECVKVVSSAFMASSSTTASNSHVISKGQQIPVSIDVSNCDPSLCGSNQRWTVSLVDSSQAETSSIKLADMIDTDRTDFNWVVNTPGRDVNTNTESYRPEYYLRVESMAKDGEHCLVGKTNSFTISSAVMNKRDDKDNKAPSEDVDAKAQTQAEIIPAPAPEEDSGLPSPPKADPDGDFDASAPAPPASGAPMFPDTPPGGPVPPFVNPSILGSQSTKTALEETDGAPAPPTGEAHGAIDPYAPHPPLSNAPNVPSPYYRDTFGTTFPNQPLPPVDPSTLPTPSNPPVEGVIFPKPPGPIPPPKLSKTGLFLRYAAAGAGILSAVGVGVGGLVGGVIGGTVGLVVGLLIASINGF